MTQDEIRIRPVAVYHGPLKDKFAVPRQSGLAELPGQIVFHEAYHDPEAIRGLEGYEYIWLIWGFSRHRDHRPRPTVRPPRLGGNERVGVFASRSPFRPNGLGLSSVRLKAIQMDKDLGPVLYVSGADLVDGSPIYDIKPYVPLSDAHPQAQAGFVDDRPFPLLKVVFADASLDGRPDMKAQIAAILALDPRPAYQRSADRTYFFEFEDIHIAFRVEGSVALVTEITQGPDASNKEESL